MAQPSLSRQLRQLEAELGEDLFDRSTGRARLTAAGEVFLPLARDLLGRAEQAESLMQGLAESAALTVRLLAPETTVADVIAPFLAHLADDAPMVDVREALPAQVYAEVIAGAADVGISSVPPPRGLTSRLIVHFPIWAYVRPSHRWAGRPAIDVAELASERTLVPGRDYGTRRQLDAAMSDAGVSYDIAAETNVPQVAHALAAAGRGVAVVSDDPRYGLHGMRILPPSGAPELRVPLYGAWDGSHYAARAISGLVDSFAAWVRERYGSPAPARDSGSSDAVSPARSRPPGP